MTNREKLGRMAIYDMLLMMNENLEQSLDENNTACVLDCIGADTANRCRGVVFCRDCIAAWLGEEVPDNA